MISCVYPDGERITDADEMETEEVYEPLGEKGVENAFIDVKVSLAPIISSCHWQLNSCATNLPILITVTHR